ncbi:MAG: hypothetical protein ABIP75_00745 [Pyrinomonadaceae bacterium]
MSTVIASNSDEFVTTPNGEVVASVRRLISQRRFWQILGWSSNAVAVAFLFILAAGVVDAWRPLPRTIRIAMLVLAASVVVATGVSSFRRLFQGRSLRADALELQTRAGQTDNALVTYIASAPIPPYVAQGLERQAQRAIDAVDSDRVIVRRPAGRGAALVFGGVVLLLVLLILAPAAVSRGLSRMLILRGDGPTRGANGAGLNTFAGDISFRPAIRKLNLRVVPPAYSGLPTTESPGDTPVRALAGSRIEMILETIGPVTGATYSFAGVPLPLRRSNDDEFAASFLADQSGALEVNAGADTADPVVPVVRAVEIYPDVIPEVHLIEPVADRVWTDVPSAPVSLRWTAKDDLGLAAVKVKYIKSRGAGDSATFENGELPAGGSNHGVGTEWSGGTAIDLRRLQMQPGDTLVVWAEGRDHRPNGDSVGRSASIALAIAAPELAKIALDGLGPNELGKFLLSQRMILQHTEKLQAERPKLAPKELNRRANDIAGEQRDFKSSFDGFIEHEGASTGGSLLEQGATGGGLLSPGQVDDKVQELAAERNETHKHGIPDSPQGSSSRVRDMFAAINAMWDAENALIDTDTAKAIVHMRTALTKLKSAQAAERYIPPVKASTQPLDLKRRYTGELADIKTRIESLALPPEAPGARSLHAALAEAYAGLSELNNSLTAPAVLRAGSLARAREHARVAAQQLSNTAGDQAAAIALAFGQLRIVEAELARINASGNSAEYAARVEKPLNLLLQASSNLFGLVSAKVQSGGGDQGPTLAAPGARSADYFRRLP